MIDVELAVTYTRVLAGIGICIGAAEYLAINAQFRGSGIFSDRIHSLNRARGPHFVAKMGRTALSHDAAVIGHAVQLGLALLLFVPLDMRAYSVLLIVLFLIQLQTFNHAEIGHDGSDQMQLLVEAALALAYAFRLKGPGAWIPLWFLVAQAVLAYATSGMSKLISPVWRSGDALELIFNTVCYGSNQVSKRLTAMPVLALIGSWTVIIFECTMPLALLAPKSIMISMLAIAGLFHLGCALTMGLNCFLWAFASTFPLLYLCNVNRASALAELEGTHADKLALLVGGVFATAVVAGMLIRYYELLPRIRTFFLCRRGLPGRIA